jgi:hypothetical protein
MRKHSRGTCIGFPHQRAAHSKRSSDNDGYGKIAHRMSSPIQITPMGSAFG